MQKEGSNLMKVRFSIGAKLITIITCIVLVSLGSIIALVSWLVRDDLQIIAEENNFEANRSSAMAAESFFKNIQSNSTILIRTNTILGTDTVLARETTDFFFEHNDEAAAVIFTFFDREEILVNEVFFETAQINSWLLDSFMETGGTFLRHAAAGETLLLNVTPDFGVFMLALFFPINNGGGAVLFSPVEISESFGRGVNQSYLINEWGDILIHKDFELVRDVVNVADREFVRNLWNSPMVSAQTLYTDEDGVRFFGAYTKLDIAGAVVITSIEYDMVFAGIVATTRRNLYLTITVLSISIIFIWFFSKSISIPLKALAKVAHKIESGEFEASLPQPKAHDEIGVLTASFQRMSKALSIFGRFTNRHIAVGAMRGEIKPGGSKKHATVFFSDIREFTAISESFANTFGEESSDRIVQWLNEYFTKMVTCVERTNGTIDKFIGDAVMAHWGAANSSGNTRKDAYNCISAALMMRKALYVLNKGRTKDNPENPRIKIGCGINTGIVTAGQLGSNVRMEYTVIGDPVNLASRVESLNKTFGTDILISENTWRLVRKKFITEEMPSVTVKGKEKPVRIFAVINYTKAEKGPKSLVKLRRILGIKPPENLKRDLNSPEKKYRISGKG